MTLIAVGDVSLGDHPVCVGHGVRSTLSRIGNGIEEHGTASLLSSGDIVLGNLETVVSDVGLNASAIRSFEMRGNREGAELLKRLGFNVLGVANNHSLQHGLDAFRDSVANVRALGIEVAGLVNEDGQGEVVQVPIRGQLVNIAAFSLRPEEWLSGRSPYWRREAGDELIAEISDIRRRVEGHLIVSVHWGLEFIDFPSVSNMKLGRALIEAGADVIIGHHPHVLQPYERHKHGVILYSLGNFLFDLWTEPMRRGAVARVILQDGALPDVEIVPIKASHAHIPQIATQDEAQEILSVMDPGRLRTAPALCDAEYAALYRKARLSFRRESHRYFMRNLHRYPPSYIVQALHRTLMRRLSGN